MVIEREMPNMDDVQKNVDKQIDGKWIEVKRWGNEWSGRTLCINPVLERAKIHDYEITRWGYHDECDIDESEEIITIEQALSMVYPDETVLSAIINIVNKDYTRIIEQLKKNERLSER